MTKTITRVWFVRLALVAAVTLGGVAASGAFAASHRQHTRHTGFSVFSHGLARAHKADAGSVSAPQGAVLAGVINTDGVTNELYAWHRAPQEDCLVDVESGGEVTTACSPSSAAETEGVSFVGKPGISSGVNVAALVPNGVTTVRITESDGSTRSVAVVNNVMDYASSNMTGFSYVMPSGSVVSHSALVSR
jgi:hypothetical protein